LPSLFLHLINGLFLLILIQKIEIATNYKISYPSKFFGVGLFLLHPIQTQAVIYISQQSTLFAAFFFLILIIGYFNFRSSYNNSTIASKGLRLIFLAIIFLLGVKSKQNVATAIFIIPLIELAFFRKYKHFNFIFSSLIASSVIAGSVYFLLGNRTSEVLGISRLDYLQTQIIVIGYYIKLIFIPIGQSIDHDVLIKSQLTNFYFWLSLLLHVSILVLAFTKRNNKTILFGVLFFYFALCLESSIFPIRDAMFEHRMYFPIIGLIFIFISLTEKLQSKAVVVIFPLIIALFFLTSINRTKVWASEKLLWENVVECYPENPRAYANLGSIFYNQNKIDSAQTLFQKAISLKPDHYESLNNLGLIHISKGEYQVAIHYLNKSIALNPSNEFALNNLGICWENSNSNGQAISYYRKALKVNPYFKNALLNQAVVFEKVGQFDEAIYNYLRLEKIDKNFPNLYFNLGNCYLKSNNYINAKKCYFKSLKLDGGTADNFSNLGISYYQLNKSDSAYFYFKKAYQKDSTREDVKSNIEFLTKKIHKKE
jgi:tetratricopeptide (TPR) repeat protein